MSSTGRRLIGEFPLVFSSFNKVKFKNSRRDSDVVAPYEKWEYFDPRVRQVEQDRNYAQNKTKKVNFQSNEVNYQVCLIENSLRLRSHGLCRTARHATIDCSSPMNSVNTFRLIFTVHVEPTNAHERHLISALIFLTVTINSIWPSRTQTVVITSPRNFSSMVSREPPCPLL